MKSQEDTPARLQDSKINVRIKIAVLWVTAVLFYIYGDYFGLFVPGKLGGMLDGKIVPLGGGVPRGLSGYLAHVGDPERDGLPLPRAKGPAESSAEHDLWGAVHCDCPCRYVGLGIPNHVWSDRSNDHWSDRLARLEMAPA